MGKHYTDSEKGYIYGQLAGKIPPRKIVQNFYHEFGRNLNYNSLMRIEQEIKHGKKIIKDKHLETRGRKKKTTERENRIIIKTV